MKLKAILIAAGAVFGLMFIIYPVFADYQLDPDRLRAEFAKAGIKTGKVVRIHGIPCLEAELPVGKSVKDVCKAVPSLAEDFPARALVVAYFSHVNFRLERGEKGETFTTQVNRLKIPLDITIFPTAFPLKDESLASRESTLIVDRKKQWGALYAGETYITCFPVATGKLGKETPAIRGVVLAKAESLYVEKSDSFLFWVIQLSPEVCLYGGLMDGPRTTKGDIRGFPEHIQEVYKLVEAGKTHFEIR